jgi:hypothetical protein
MASDMLPVAFMVHRVYCSPGLFSFGRLGVFDSFVHVERSLERRFRERGHDCLCVVADAPPTASVHRRAALLAETVRRTCGVNDGPIHLLGHSTGGLDARLLTSPRARLPVPAEALDWVPRVASVTTMNTPHLGTPLAKFFATVSGQRFVYALSALTFIGLSLGSPPLSVASLLVGLAQRGERARRVEWSVVDRVIGLALRTLDEASRRDARAFLEAIRQDQGAVIQLTPEAMELYQAAVEPRAGVVYQSTVSMAPFPEARVWFRLATRPSTAVSVGVFTALHAITTRDDPRYPCAAMRLGAEGPEPWAGDAAEAVLDRAFGPGVSVRANDGVVPIRSQLFGRVIWAGYGDHHDVLGHFRGAAPRDPEAPRYHDWLASGSAFDEARFESLMDAIATGMLDAEAAA